MERILVIAPQYIGDSILAIPFLRELKKHCGRTEIDVVSKNSGCLIFSACPYIRKVYNLKSLSIKELRANHYTKAYILKRSLSAALLALFAGIRDTVGFGGQFREIFIKKIVKYDKSQKKHELEHFMDVLRDDYVEITDKSLEYFVQPSAESFINQYLNPEKKSALIVACSSTPVKDWNVEGFAKTIDFLSEKGYSIYFTGLEKEKTCCESLTANIKKADVHNLCGKLTFEQTVALVSKMDLVFGVDSGFCHMGAAFKKQVITLFGPTSKYQWAPIGENCHVVSLDLDCSPCSKPKKCKNSYKCLQDLTADRVIAALKKFCK